MPLTSCVRRVAPLVGGRRRPRGLFVTNHGKCMMWGFGGVRASLTIILRSFRWTDHGIGSCDAQDASSRRTEGERRRSIDDGGAASRREGGFLSCLQRFGPHHTKKRERENLNGTKKKDPTIEAIGLDVRTPRVCFAALSCAAPAPGSNT